MGSAHMLAEQFLNLAPGLTLVRWRGMSAMNIRIPGTFKAEYLETLEAKVRAHEEAVRAAKEAAS